VRSALLLLPIFLLAQPRPPVRSQVTIISADGRNQRVVYSAPRLFEAPNWSPDGSYLLLNSEGKLWKLPVAGGEPEVVFTGSVKGINNDHGISPDGKWFAISAGHIYLLPSSGGEPRQLTSRRPSYYHGWSPDGRTLVYCAEREKNFDIYAISVEGGEEKRLTVHPGYDDGPDYSPDGQWIYFNSDRSGSWDIWRIPATGAGEGDGRAQRVTSDEWEDWFPHPSPDGKWLVFLSYEKGTQGHPANRNVLLRRMPLPGRGVGGGNIEVIARLFGGQGTINVNSWSPDGQYLAFVSYQAISE
jgi:Tol biopolymer transport system component